MRPRFGSRSGPETGPTLRRIAAFSDTPEGGNPAGVWIGDALPSPPEMQRIATGVGYSETAFLAPEGDKRFRVRYYSLEAEVSFCGHATIAAGVVLGERWGEGRYLLSTAVGLVPVSVAVRGGRLTAALTSVEPRRSTPDAALLADVLEALGWRREDLDPAIPPQLAYAGAWHFVIAVARRSALDGLAYDFDRLKRAMLHAGLTTAQLVWRESERLFHARNPFPVGGVVEDPATGAAAAALGGYLRDAGLLRAPAEFVIRQGVAMGRPSRIEVSVPESGGIRVAGTAVSLDDASPNPRKE